MKLGVLVEGGDETRVAIVPNSVPKLMKLGFEVHVESGAGVSAHHLDAEYEAKGASIVSRDDAMACETKKGQQRDNKVQPPWLKSLSQMSYKK